MLTVKPELIQNLAKLTDGQRLEFMNTLNDHFCPHCGRWYEVPLNQRSATGLSARPCQCWNDA